MPCGEQKSVFPAKNYVDSVPASFAVSRRAKLFGRLPLELHLTLFPQGNRERKVVRTTEKNIMKTITKFIFGFPMLALACGSIAFAQVQRQ